MDFDTVFSRVYPALFRYCVRLTGDPDVADEVAQDSFVRMHESGAEGDIPGLRAWLFKTATRLVRDRVRVRKNRERLLRENPDEAANPSVPETPESALERSEEVRKVRTALERLDPRDRKILLLREEGFRYREIAGMIDVAASSVGTLLARARERFARAYRDENPDEIPPDSPREGRG